MTQPILLLHGKCVKRQEGRCLATFARRWSADEKSFAHGESVSHCSKSDDPISRVVASLPMRKTDQIQDRHFAVRRDLLLG